MWTLTQSQDSLRWEIMSTINTLCSCFCYVCPMLTVCKPFYVFVAPLQRFHRKDLMALLKRELEESSDSDITTETAKAEADLDPSDPKKK